MAAAAGGVSYARSTTQRARRSAPVLDPVPEPAKAPADKPKARQPKVEANIIAPVEYSPAY